MSSEAAATRRQGPISRALLPLSALAAALLPLAIARPAGAACVNQSGGDAFSPGSGQTVVCDAAAPNPVTTPIAAAGGATGVTVRLDAGSALTSAGATAVTLGAGSQVTNAGAITGSIGVQIGAGTVTNDGAITGTAGAGIVFSGAGTLVNRGTITGSGTIAVQFANADSQMTMEGGTISGLVQQGASRDSFTMSDGTIQALSQGDSRDTFTMSGGRIIGNFNDGDVATMTGGMIGNVNMMLDKNIFLMSGGTIERNLIAAFDDDRVELSGGFIGGNISLSAGSNIVIVTGGQLAGMVLTSTGTDLFTWADNGLIGGINLGGGNDTATIRGVPAASIAAATLFDGGLGADQITLDAVAVTGVSRFQRWETVALTNGTAMTLDANLTLGDEGTGTGSLSVDAGSRILAGGGVNASILAAVAGGLVGVVNNGTIDLTNGGSGATDRLTIAGNYSGNGRLLLQAVLGADNAPADRLVIAGGRASGATGIGITNLGGAGALTTADGIMVVQAANGGTTAPGAFTQATALQAGPYRYFLYRGGVSAGTTENWYLRSSAPPPPVPTPDNPNPVAPQLASQILVLPPTPENPAPVEIVVTPPLPVPAAGEAPIPLYRPEVAARAVVPPMARQLVFATLGTFHDRQGEQRLLQGGGFAPGAWARAFGQHLDQRWSGDVGPGFDGTIVGLQLGLDLYAIDWGNGHRDRFGLFLGYAEASGDVRGSVLGDPRARAGRLNLEGVSLGGAWTHLGPGEWYLDGVLMHTWLGGDQRSTGGIRGGIDGTVLTASIEGGYPLPLGGAWRLEPQAQLIWQRISVSDTQDPVSTIAYRNSDGLTGRLGLRLSTSFPQGDAGVWQPYLKANLWHGGGGNDVVAFDATPIATRRSATSLEIGGGVTAQLGRAVGIYAALAYSTDLDSNSRQGFAGNLGIRITF